VGHTRRRLVYRLCIVSCGVRSPGSGYSVGRGPGEVSIDATHAVPKSERCCTKTLQVYRADEGDDESGGGFVEAAFFGDKLAGVLCEAQGWVCGFDFTFDG
jgi:hypothetical protein